MYIHFLNRVIKRDKAIIVNMLNLKQAENNLLTNIIGNNRVALKIKD